MKTTTIFPVAAGCALVAALAGYLVAATNPPAWTATENAEWHPVDPEATYIAPDSALDMSRFIESPAGKHRRVALSASGRLVSEEKPEQRVVFFGCSTAPHEILGRSCTTKEAIQQWAESVRRQGYNLVRPLFLDHYRRPLISFS